MLKFVLRGLIGLAVITLAPHAQDDLERRRAYLDELREILPANKEWEAWLEETGELPPDFESLPSWGMLPFVVDDGVGRISEPEDWPKRRRELLALFYQWMLGTVPPRPENLTANVRGEDARWGATVRDVELTFGPGKKAKLSLQVYLPEGDGPFPVFMTQDNHRAWAMIALRRGYACVVYAGSDSNDDTHTFIEAYPEHDWSKLARRAWAAGRCIDYLETVPEVNTAQIVLTGHSRNGKMSLMASALDERIDAVISSSSGAGGVLPTFHYSEQHFGEGIELITRNFPDWFHPRWRFFVGRENKLPVDLHHLVALSAPRPCLLSIAYNDGVESTWAMQQTYLSAKHAYSFLGVPENLSLLWRPNGHETWPTVIERFLDWSDTQFGRGDYAFPERLIHPWDWDAWRENVSNPIDPNTFPERSANSVLKLADGSEIKSKKQLEKRRVEIGEGVRTMLGTPPPGGRIGPSTYGSEPAHIEQVLGRREAGTGLRKEDVVFGEYINADVYMPAAWEPESGEKHPAILWLHPASHARGYVAAYRRGEQAFRTMARAGFAVYCYDQVGHGRRIEEVEGFYTRHPDWSLLGKMVRDAREALDAMEAQPYIDGENISVVGYGLGAMVALHLAAVDERPARYALAGVPEPFRLNFPIGVIRWAQTELLMPQFGMFLHAESRLPYDVPDLLAAMAPRPAFLLCPTINWESDAGVIIDAAEAANKAYAIAGNDTTIEWATPKAYNHFDPHMQRIVIDWLKGS